ncbi:MAG TPA: hypothetical protein VNN08_10045 [Thermoanaerobaculia bacterium]|nr:hypothetical protein [Thermoanaerobaculia bacterium]
MIAELIAIGLALAAGVPLARLLDRDGPASRLIGEGVLLGIGVCAALLCVMPWSRGMMILPQLVIAGGAAWGGRAVRAEDRAPRYEMRWGALVFYAITITALIGYALFATLAPSPEFDYLADWGFKARAFFEIRSIDWQLLIRAGARDTHPDYPLLLPLTYDFIAILRNGWSDAHLGVVHVAFAAALLLVIHGTALEETRSRVAAAFLTAALVPLAATPWMGIAEGPFIAYATAALLLLRSGKVTIGAILLGLAASTKNEGLTLIAAAALGLVCARRAREVIRLWPAIVIPMPWLMARLFHRLPTDIATGGVITRVVAHLRNPRPILAAISSASLGKPLFWIALAAGIVIASRTLATRERFVVSALLVQFAFYLGAYAATPYDVAWHVTWSWERLVAHLTPALTFVVLQALLVRYMTDTSVSLETSITSN